MSARLLITITRHNDHVKIYLTESSFPPLSSDPDRHFYYNGETGKWVITDSDTPPIDIPNIEYLSIETHLQAEYPGKKEPKVESLSDDTDPCIPKK